MAIVENYTEPDHPAATFNVDDWLQDARLPEESADVYKRADVIGELGALRRKIDVQREAAASPERTAGDAAELTPLEQQYEALLQTFADSQLTVYVRALGPDERRAIREDSEARTKDQPPLDQNADHGLAILSAAVVAVRPYGGQRVDVTWSRDQVRAMENKIGGTQMQQVLHAYQAAQNRVPAVDADFLHRPSGEETGQG
jgi:hypothetical protein